MLAESSTQNITDAEQAADILSDIISALKPRPRTEKAEGWNMGQLPDHGPCVLTVDGLGTSSSPRKSILPWRDVLIPVLAHIDASLEVRGFSYAGAGNEYRGRHTNIDLRRGAYDHFLESAPRPGQAITYITFSFGGPLAILGLAAWLDRNPSAEAVHDVHSLILVEPAFSLRGPVVDALHNIPDSTFTVLEQFDGKPSPLFSEILSALRTITSRGIRVAILYWEGDKVLDYSAPIIRRLRRRGANCYRVHPTFVPSTREFPNHVRVATDESVHKKIQSLLR